MMRRIAFIFPVLCFSVAAVAQNNGLPKQLNVGDTIIAVGKYTVTLTDARRIPTEPRLEVPETKAPNLQFDFNLNQVAVPNTIQLPDAQRMDKKSPVNYHHNYIRAAYGNYNNALVDAYFVMPGKKGMLSVDAHFMNTKPKTERLQREFNAGIGGIKHFKKGDFKAGFRFTSNDYRFYGFESDSLNNTIASLKQRFQIVDVNAGYSSRLKGKRAPFYAVGAQFYNMKQNALDTLEATENGLSIDGIYRFTVNKNPLSLVARYEMQQFQSIKDTFTRNFIHLQPFYTLSNKNWDLNLGFNSTIIVESGENTEFKFFPRIDGVYRMEGDLLSLFGGVNGGVNKVSLRSISEMNPYIAPYQNLDPSISKLRFNAGLTGKLGQNTGFTTQLLFHIHNQMPLYILDTVDTRWFMNVRADVKLIQFNAELSHAFSNKFRTNLTFNAYSYDVLGYEHAYQLPNLDLKLNATHNIGDKILLSADVFTIGKRYSYLAYSEQQSAELLKAFVDASVGIDYRWKKQISAFLKVNNIANQKYQMWGRLPVNGITVMGGLAVGF
ncbi:MAG: hypothetical protein EP332_07850 [Bacteroidetes bacterium]|nr:MAG: hypothetical protein EP332_07850 [Bacteroidota bacterium]